MKLFLPIRVYPDVTGNDVGTCHLEKSKNQESPRGMEPMKNKKAVWIAGIFIVLIGTTTVVAATQNVRQARQRLTAGQRALARPLAWARGLNLTQEQRDQIKGILANHKTEITSVAKENRQARQELRDALANGADVQTLKAAYDKVSSAGWDRVLLRNKISTEIKPILTPEQLQKLQKRLNRIDNLAQRLNRRLDR